MKLLLTGASGLLGCNFRNYATTVNDLSLVGTQLSSGETSLVTLNLTDKEAVDKFFSKYKFDACIHAAAECDPDRCARAPEQTHDLNVSATQYIAEACERYKIRLIYLSTDYVFGGVRNSGYDESVTPDPIQLYGRTKFAGEQIINARCENSVIFRVPIFYGFNSTLDKPIFFTQVLKNLLQGKQLTIDNKQIRYPVLIDDISLALLELVFNQDQGIVHFAPNQGVTKYTWAKEIANQFALDDSLIKPIEGVTALADRPLNNRMIFTRTDLLMSTRARELVEGIEFLSKLISETDLRSFI